MENSVKMRELGLGITDVVEYLKLMNEEDNEEMISLWGEDIAYDLYSSEEYRRLQGYVLYYMFEIISGNIRVQHYNESEGTVGLKYFSPNGVNTYWGQSGWVTSRVVTITNKHDMRDQGARHFTDFMRYYIHGIINKMVENAFTGDTILYTPNTMDKLETAIRFLEFTVRERMGVVTSEQFLGIKDTSLALIDEGLTKERLIGEGNDSEVYRRGEFLKETIEEVFNLVKLY